MKANKLALGVLAGALSWSALVVAQPAYADPSGGAFRSLAGVGSDTTQSVMNAISEAVTDSSSGSKIIASYDAINPGTGLSGGTITTRSGGPAFNRPDGSGSGIKALTSSVKGLTYPAANGTDITDQLDFARSSSGPSGSGSDLTYIPFAKDAVTYAYSSAATHPVPADLSQADLKSIYNGTLKTYTIGATSYPYAPMLPQSGSGTRKYFLSSLGLTETDVAWITATFQENKGTTISGDGVLAPFSIASYIAQTNAVVTNTVTANSVVLGTIDGAQPIVSGSLNTTFPFTRNVYNVVATARLSGTGAADKLLQSTFVGTTSKVCSQGTIITTYGFGTLSNCGSTTTTGPFTVDGSAPTVTNTALPVISGSASVGSVLTATNGTFAGPISSPTFSYQWKRGTTAITGATAANYTVVAADQGQSLSVTVTAAYRATSGSATSAVVVVPAATVTKAASRVAVSFDKNAKKHTRKGKATVVVTASVTATGAVTIYSKTTVKKKTVLKKIGTGTLWSTSKGKVVVKLSRLAKGKRTIVVTYAGSTTVAASTKTVTLKVK